MQRHWRHSCASSPTSAACSAACGSRFVIPTCRAC
jgi:hypothetical protein